MLQPEVEMRDYQMIIQKSPASVNLLFFGWQKTWLPKKKKTEGISKHPPTFCRLRSQNLGIKNSQPEGEVTGDDFDTHVKESRLNIYVSFLEKKTRYLK